MIEITNFRQGAVLNHNHGVETEHGLKIRICGITDSSIPVKINGVPAETDGRNFSCDVELTEKINTVCAEAITPYGTFSQKLVLVWDKKSYGCYYDPLLGVFFFGGFACGNLIPLNEIHLRWSTHNAKAEKYGWETFSFITHEQYSFPYYSNCIPDHLQRLDEMARCTVDEGGCKPVFYREGLLGNTARGK